MKDNKLIAEFMGMELGDDKTMYYDDAENLHPPTPINELKFHSSWDWLMPVVIKCFEVDEQTNDDLNFKLNDALLETNIDSLYKVVVEFIKQLNNKTIKVKVQQRSVYHKFVELEVEVPDSVKLDDVREWLTNNDQLWSDQVDQAMFEAPIQFGNGMEMYKGMNEVEADSEWRYETPDGIGGHL